MKNDDAHTPSYTEIPEGLYKDIENIRKAYMEKVRMLEADFNKTVELLITGFLSDKEIPVDKLLKLENNRIYFIEPEQEKLE